MLGNEKDYLATRTSYKLNLRGPSLNIQTACSTSLVAVAQAYQALQGYQCDMAIAGGISITSPQKRGYLYHEGAIVSPDGHCRAFDAQAGGTVFSNGTGVVLLKRLADAVADHDHIYAVIKGVGVNNDGSARVSFAAPSVDGQAEAIAMAQALAGVDADSITYVEAHGTGTALGDPVEIAGLTQAFRLGTERNQFCAIGSVKSNIGHLDAAAGIAGLIKTSLALQNAKIPASLHYTQPNPKINFAETPFYVNARLADWPSGETPRRAGVSAFGSGGTNAHVILEEAPELQASGPARAEQLFVLSARSQTGSGSGSQQPGRTSGFQRFCLSIWRMRRLHCRPAGVISHIAGQRWLARLPKLQRRWSPAIPSVCGHASVSMPMRPWSFLFPGQGAQQVNMGRGLYENEPIFAAQVDECAEVLRPLLGLDLRTLLYPQPGHEEEASRQLKETFITQPSLFVVEYALAQLWMQWGVAPKAMIGHSLGEYVAACLAGVFSRNDALRILSARARMMQDLPAGAMLAVRLPEAEVIPLLGEKLSIAALNSPGHDSCFRSFRCHRCAVCDARRKESDVPPSGDIACVSFGHARSHAARFCRSSAQRADASAAGAFCFQSDRHLDHRRASNQPRLLGAASAPGRAVFEWDCRTSAGSSEHPGGSWARANAEHAGTAASGQTGRAGNRGVAQERGERQARSGITRSAIKRSALAGHQVDARSRGTHLERRRQRGLGRLPWQ